MPNFYKTTSTAGNDIVNAARSQIGSLSYKRYGYSDNTPAGVPKDHNFIANTLDNVGLGFGDNPFGRPSAADWADSSSTIPGWQPVGDGSVQAGDVLATPKPIQRNWYEGGGQQLGIATGTGSTIGVIDNNRIGESDFGLKDGQNPVTWRSTQLDDSRPQVDSEGLPPPPDYRGCPIANDPTRSCPWGSIKDPTGGKDGNVDPGINNVPNGTVPGTGDTNMPNYFNGNGGQYTGRTFFDT
jgi:hypothetical protein